MMQLVRISGELAVLGRNAAVKILLQKFEQQKSARASLFKLTRASNEGKQYVSILPESFSQWLEWLR